MIHRANKIRIYPTPEQESVLRQRMGASRFVWNWCLAKWGEEYKSGNKPTAYKMAKLFRANKPEWFKEMDSSIVDVTCGNLGAAFSAFLSKRSNYPNFKQRGLHDSYQVRASAVKVSDKSIRVPKLNSIRMSEPLFRQGKVIGNITFSVTGGRWYVAIHVEIEDFICNDQESTTKPSVGLDLGIATFATLSTGEKIENPKHLKEAERRLAIRQRRLSRKEKGSKNREKAKEVVARTHAQVANKRKGFLHQTTTDLSKRFESIAIEDLNVAGMLKNHHLAKAISGASFAEFRRQLEYKMPDRVHVVDRWFPSSKTCSDCGHKLDKLPLSVREWTCPECGSIHDRDVNAAKNLINEAGPD